MTWLAWRQFRPQAIAAAGCLAVLTIVLAVTGPQLAHLYSASGISACRANGDCGAVTERFLSLSQVRSDANLLRALDYLIFVIPALIGIFWGAPLIARELEAGTHRLAWNQSVTRSRWLTVKVGLVGLAAMATAGLVSLVVNWWGSPIYTVHMDRITPGIFAATGIVPVGYAVFAFALGVAAGVLTRRTVPAMAITLAIFAVVQIAMPTLIRQHLIAPDHRSTAVTAVSLTGNTVRRRPGGNSSLIVFTSVTMPGAWVLSNRTVTAAGHAYTGPAPQACMSQSAAPQACEAGVLRLNLRQLVTYLPASRYWTLQWYETAIFLMVSLGLTGFCFWRVRRRQT
jgi:hypothetical protein